MKLTYNQIFAIVEGTKELVHQMLPVKEAVKFAKFTSGIQAALEGFDKERLEILKLEGESEQQAAFEVLLAKEAELEDFKFSSLPSLKISAAMINQLEFMGLW